MKKTIFEEASYNISTMKRINITENANIVKKTKDHTLMNEIVEYTSSQSVNDLSASFLVMREMVISLPDNLNTPCNDQYIRKRPNKREEYLLTSRLNPSYLMKEFFT
jgi:hypothetical protein